MASAGVTGLRETIKALEQLGVDVADLKEVFHPLAARAAGLIQAATPVGKTGRLAKSVKPNNAKNKAVVRAGSAARVPYAHAINYGWPAHNIKPAGFMQAADDDLPPDVLAELVLDGLADIIDRYGLNQ